MGVRYDKCPLYLLTVYVFTHNLTFHLPNRERKFVSEEHEAANNQHNREQGIIERKWKEKETRQKKKINPHIGIFGYNIFYFRRAPV